MRFENQKSTLVYRLVSLENMFFYCSTVHISAIIIRSSLITLKIHLIIMFVFNPVCFKQ